MVAKVLRDRRSSSVNRPIQWRTAINCVFDVQACASFHQQPYHLFVIRPHGVMQRRRMRMVTVRIVPVRILARVGEQAHDVSVTVLSYQRQGDMLALGISNWEQPGGVLKQTMLQTFRRSAAVFPTDSLSWRQRNSAYINAPLMTRHHSES
jgi:hypothetical protein